MSWILDPLRLPDVSGYGAPYMARLSEQVRLRLREEMDRLDLSQRDVANLLKWSQSKVAHQLTGRVEMSVDDLAELCFALNLNPTEAVRDRGMEFCAEMTPTELRILERIRQLPPPVLAAIMTLLDVRTKTRPEDRHAAATVKKPKSDR
jgi:transcriptional regulator with XRE-family HTH domain